MNKLSHFSTPTHSLLWRMTSSTSGEVSDSSILLNKISDIARYILTHAMEGCTKAMLISSGVQLTRGYSFTPPISFGLVSALQLMPRVQATFFEALGGFSDEVIQGLAITSDGGIVGVGRTASYGVGGNEVFLSKWWANGTFAWANTLGGSGFDVCFALATTSNEEIVASGVTDSFGAGGNDVLLAKWWNNGTLAWARTLGGVGYDYAAAHVTAPAGGIFVAGATSSSGAGNSDMLLSHWDTNGIHLWTKTLGGNTNDYASAIALTSDGALAVAGYTSSFGIGGIDIIVSHWWTNGTLTWVRTLGGMLDDYSNALTATPDGGIVVGGYTDSFGIGRADIILAKWWGNGTLAWARTIGGLEWDQSEALMTVTDGSIVIGGYTNSSGAGGFDVMLSKWSTNGSLTWARTLGGATLDSAFALTKFSQGEIVVGGYTNSISSGNLDELIATLTSDGTMSNCNNLRVMTPTVSNVTGLVNITTPSITSQNYSNPTVKDWNTTAVSSVSPTTVEQCFPTVTTQAGAQPTFLETLGGAGADVAYALTTTPDGGIMASGYTTSFGAGNKDVLLAKWWTNGSLAWAETVGGGNDDEAFAIKVILNEEVVIAGYTGSFGAGGLDILLAKWWTNGTRAWTKTLGGIGDDAAYALTTISDGGIIACGGTSSFGSGGQDAFLAKWWTNGTLVWIKTFGGTGADYTTALSNTPDGGVVASGATTSFGAGGVDVFLAKWWNNGTLVWTRTLGGGNVDALNALITTNDGGIIATGETLSFGGGGSDILFAKWWTNGTFAWAKTLDGAGEDQANALIVTPDEGIVLGGRYTNVSAGNDVNVLFAKWWINGTLNWTKILGGTGHDDAFALTASPDGGIIACGLTSSFTGSDYDVLLASMDFDGQISNCSYLHDITLTVTDRTSAITSTTPAVTAQNWNNATLQDWSNVNVSIITPTLSEQCLSVPAPITTGMATTGMAPVTTGIQTTGSSTTGVATTGIATTGNPTTGVATTGQGTTGIATTGVATTGQATTGNPTTGTATTGKPPSSTAPSETKTQDSSKSSQSSDSTSLIVGLATTAGVLTFLCGAAFIGLYFVRRRQKNGDNQTQTELTTQAAPYAAPNIYADFEGAAGSHPTERHYQNAVSRNADRVDQNPYGLVMPVAGQQKQAEAPIYIQAPQQMGQGTKLEGSGEASMSSGYVPAPPDVQYAFSN